MKTKINNLKKLFLNFLTEPEEIKQIFWLIKFIADWLFVKNADAWITIGNC
jgi:hypothetical protein